MKRYESSKYIIYPDGTIINEKTGRPLKPQDNGKGYKKVTLTINGKQIQKYVHRLVAELFLSTKSIQVNHKNGNKSDNRVENLEWVTNSENQVHAHKIGLKSNGNKLWNGKFSPSDIERIKSMRKIGWKINDIAKEMSTTKSTISEILSGKRYKYV